MLSLGGVAGSVALLVWLGLGGQAQGGFRPLDTRSNRHRLTIDRRWLTPMSALVLWWVVGGVPGVLAAILAVWWLPRWLAGLEPYGAKRRREQLRREAPTAVTLIATAVQSGAALPRALELVAQSVGGVAAEELEPVVRRLNLGEAPSSVWRGLAQHEAFAVLGRTLARGSSSGAPVSEQLTRAAIEMQRQRRSEVMARARGLEVRCTVPLGVCMLPAFICLGVVPMVGSLVGGLWSA